MPASPPHKSTAGLLTLSQVLKAVHGELRQSYDPTATQAGEGGRREEGTLHALTEEDWNIVLYPVSELRPYFQASSSSARPTTAPETELCNEAVLTNYVKCRCAELPMRLQTEAVLLRRHEYVVRQRMHELIELSEYIALCGGEVPELRPDKAGDAGTMRSSAADAGRAPFAAATSSGFASAAEGELPSDVVPLLSVSEAARRLQRAQERVGELEKLVQQESWQRLRCSQRMLLMTAVTRALLRQLQGMGSAPVRARDDPDEDSRPTKKPKRE